MPHITGTVQHVQPAGSAWANVVVMVGSAGRQDARLDRAAVALDEALEQAQGNKGGRS